MKVKSHPVSFALSLFAFVVAAGLCALLMWEADAFEYSFLKVARHDMRLRTEDATDELSAFLKAGNLQAVREYAEDSRHDGVRVTVLDATGRPLVEAGKPDRSVSARRKEFADTLANGESLTIRQTDVLGEYMLYSSRKVGDYVVRLAIPYRQAREAARIAEVSLAVAASLGMFFAVAIFLLTRHFYRRIAALASEREEQLRRLEEAERMERFRREFIENISHEIKTPLATVMGSVEMLGGDLPLPEKERPSLVRLILRESRRMARLFDDILCLARLESTDRRRDSLETLDFSLVVRDVVDACRPSADKAGATVFFDDAEPLEVKGDARMLEMAVCNLLSNAIKYGDGSDVVVTLTKVANRAVLRVRDGGPGIAAEHIPRLFERFYRVDKARSRDSGGTGLGLSIVKHVALFHGGTASCESEVGNGSVFVLEVPCALS